MQIGSTFFQRDTLQGVWEIELAASIRQTTIFIALLVRVGGKVQTVKRS